MALAWHLAVGDEFTADTDDPFAEASLSLQCVGLAGSAHLLAGVGGSSFFLPQNRVAVSVDGGRTWPGDYTAASMGLPHSVATDDTNVVAAVSNAAATGSAGVVFSSDGGVTWSTRAVVPVAGPLIGGVSPSLGVAITPDGATVYVCNFGAGTVTPVDVATGTAGTPIGGFANPYSIAITPDGTKAYVTENAGSALTPVDLATNTRGAPIIAFTQPTGVAITPDGAKAYVTDYGGVVTPVDLATNTAGTPISGFFQPWGIAITPDGATAYVTEHNAARVTPIHLATNTVGAHIALPFSAHPYGIAITPDGTKAYVCNSAIDTVTPINLATNTAGTAITGFNGPLGVAISGDGATAYVTNNGGSTVDRIDIATGLRLGPISDAGGSVTISSAPWGIAITPDGTRAYVCNSDSGAHFVTPIDLRVLGFIPDGPLVAAGGSFWLVGHPSGGSAHLYRSADGGSTWRLASPQPVATAMAAWSTMSATGSNIILGGQDNSSNQVCAYTLDAGVSWTATPTPPSAAPEPKMVLLAATGRLIVGDSGDIYYSDDNGATWHTSTLAGFTIAQSSQLAQSGAILLAGIQTAAHSGIIAVSTDNGTTWTLPASQPFIGGGCNTLTSTAQRIWAGGYTSDFAHTLAWASLTVLPLRQRQRDDSLISTGRVSAGANRASSRQASLRQGSANTYL